MDKQVMVFWDGRPRYFSQYKIETAWLVIQEVIDSNPDINPESIQILVIAHKMLQDEHNFSRADAYAYSIAARGWSPGG